MKNTQCMSCRFATIDKSASTKRWKAYECSNSSSEYHKALLNVTPSGEKCDKITWSGCEFGEVGA